ncbi:MAG: hypothetical protein J6C91_06215 [Muribaculaceae bacterium]|nr:hypothetical protein [Muribaculaceae bacterium]
MNAVGSLQRFFVRQRHKRGFGVHSPFGYYFITKIIAEGHYGYYCYPRLNVLARKSGESARHLRLLMRISTFLADGHICTVGASQARISALTAGDSSRRVYTFDEYRGVSSAPFIYIAEPALFQGHLGDFAAERATVIIERCDTPEGRALLQSAAPLGMTFAGRRMAVVVIHQGLPSQLIRVAL